MKRINDFIKSIQEDKKAHLIVGVLTGFPMEFLDWLYSSIPVFQYLIIYNL
jgi:hypothetical protein